MDDIKSGNPGLDMSRERACAKLRWLIRLICPNLTCSTIRVKGKKASVAWEAGLKGLPYVPTGLSFNGMIFLLNDGGIMTCRRASDGKVLWQERVVGAPYSSPILINDKIYCFSKEGDMSVMAASSKLELLDSFKFPEGIYATPAVAGGKLFVRTFSNLYCISK